MHHAIRLAILILEEKSLLWHLIVTLIPFAVTLDLAQALLTTPAYDYNPPSRALQISEMKICLLSNEVVRDAGNNSHVLQEESRSPPFCSDLPPGRPSATCGSHDRAAGRVIKPGKHGCMKMLESARRPPTLADLTPRRQESSPTPRPA